MGGSRGQTVEGTWSLVSDPSERLNRAEKLPEKISELRVLMEKMAEDTGTRVAEG